MTLYPRFIVSLPSPLPATPPHSQIILPSSFFRSFPRTDRRTDGGRVGADDCGNRSWMAWGGRCPLAPSLLLLRIWAAAAPPPPQCYHEPGRLAVEFDTCEEAKVSINVFPWKLTLSDNLYTLLTYLNKYSTHPSVRRPTVTLIFLSWRLRKRRRRRRWRRRRGPRPRPCPKPDAVDAMMMMTAAAATAKKNRKRPEKGRCPKRL